MPKSSANRRWKVAIFLRLPANFVFRNSFIIALQALRMAYISIYPTSSSLPQPLEILRYLDAISRVQRRLG